MHEFRTHPCFALSASVVDPQLRLLHTPGSAFPLSFISFPVFQSKSTTSPSVELAGQITSPAPCPSCPSQTQKQQLHPSVHVISTVVSFPTFVAVTQAIPFPAGHVHPCGH